jgi:hypothetical protein
MLQRAFVTATWNVNSVINCGTLLENFTVIVMAGSDGDERVARREMLMLESVITISFDEGRPLLSGSADENAHSSSSFVAGGALAGGGALAKSNIDAEAGVADWFG